MSDRYNQESENIKETPDQQAHYATEMPSKRSGSAQVFQANGDEHVVTTQDIKGRAVVSVENGQKIGSVSDIIIDADKLQVAALIVSKGSLFDRETVTIPAEQVQVWGQDVILVREISVIDDSAITPEGKHWLNAEENIRGRYVVSVDGKRIGQIEDISISPDGRLMAYQLSQVFIEGPLEESKRIDVSSTHSLGEDVLIVNSVDNL
jgi:uncharacterized protein YrrD